MSKGNHNDLNKTQHYSKVEFLNLHSSFFVVCTRFCVSHCALRLTSASDMFIVNQKPDLAGGHGQSVRKEITHNEGTHAVKKHLGHLF